MNNLKALLASLLPRSDAARQACWLGVGTTLIVAALSLFSFTTLYAQCSSFTRGQSCANYGASCPTGCYADSGGALCNDGSGHVIWAGSVLSATRYRCTSITATGVNSSCANILTDCGKTVWYYNSDPSGTGTGVGNLCNTSCPANYTYQGCFATQKQNICGNTTALTP